MSYKKIVIFELISKIDLISGGHQRVVVHLHSEYIAATRRFDARDGMSLMSHPKRWRS
jgi:hypothetical protein